MSSQLGKKSRSVDDVCKGNQILCTICVCVGVRRARSELLVGVSGIVVPLMLSNVTCSSSQVGFMMDESAVASSTVTNAVLDGEDLFAGAGLFGFGGGVRSLSTPPS